MTSATERIRALLDERGVEWADIDTGGKRSLITLWHCTDGMEWQFYENTKTNWTLLKSRRDYLTPEQAVETTLGRGECHITDSGPWGYPYVCSECEASFDPDVNGGEFNYCPNCGRKVVQE